MKYIFLYSAFLLLMSLITLLTYGIDKRKARTGSWRIPESRLLLLGFFGGAAGALLAMKIFHHKTKHAYFWILNIFALAFQVFLLVILRH
ncbi:MAG: DUF1294 domain-containing protein [Oscillospiraceae bacterium]|nr:DUF1294 domain-containing protein [Oscillospiraceae bacterium]